VIHFENPPKKREKVEKNITDMELTSVANTETLWENFERTGSVEAFLRFAQSTKTDELMEFVDLPS